MSSSNKTAAPESGQSAAAAPSQLLQSTVPNSANPADRRAIVPTAPAGAIPIQPHEPSRPFSRAHPWHGVSIGGDAPEVVTVYVEIVPTDTVKYELDKETGILRVDRPQRYSNVCPALYGLLPRTHCGDATANFCMERTGREGLIGDGDPLDICVLTEKAIMHGDILVRAIPVGGLRMLDHNEADDKIIAVLESDAVYGWMTKLADLPPILIDRLRHYFLTYKSSPDSSKPPCEITHVYDREEAHEVIRRSQSDYAKLFAPRP